MAPIFIPLKVHASTPENSIKCFFNSNSSVLLKHFFWLSVRPEERMAKNRIQDCDCDRECVKKERSSWYEAKMMFSKGKALKHFASGQPRQVWKVTKLAYKLECMILSGLLAVLFCVEKNSFQRGTQ